MGNNINGAKYRDAPDRVFRRILAAERDVTAEGCWLWRGEISHDGYGETRYRAGKKRPHIYVHRLVYMRLVGELADADELDHLCHDPDACAPADGKCPHRRCFNPAHLEPVTSRVNLLRAGGIAGINARKDECPSGHLYDEANTRWYRNSRRCRKCERGWQIASYELVGRPRERARRLAAKTAARQGRACKICGSDISHRTRKAIYCEGCAPGVAKRQDAERHRAKAASSKEAGHDRAAA